MKHGQRNSITAEKLLLNKMRKIRRKDRYKNMYSYSDFSGDCVGKKYAVRGAVYIRHSKINQYTKGWYNGLYFQIVGAAAALICPELGYMWTAISIGTEWGQYDSMKKAKVTGKEAFKLGIAYLEKKSSRKIYKLIFKGLSKSIDMLEFLPIISNDNVKIGDDLCEICVQRGVKKPKTASEATQSLASFVMRGMKEPLYCEMGADYGDDPLT